MERHHNSIHMKRTPRSCTLTNLSHAKLSNRIQPTIPQTSFTRSQELPGEDLPASQRERDHGQVVDQYRGLEMIHLRWEAAENNFWAHSTESLPRPCPKLELVTSSQPATPTPQIRPWTQCGTHLHSRLWTKEHSCIPRRPTLKEKVEVECNQTCCRTADSNNSNRFRVTPSMVSMSPSQSARSCSHTRGLIPPIWDNAYHLKIVVILWRNCYFLGIRATECHISRLTVAAIVCMARHLRSRFVCLRSRGMFPISMRSSCTRTTSPKISSRNTAGSSNLLRMPKSDCWEMSMSRLQHFTRRILEAWHRHPASSSRIHMEGTSEKTWNEYGNGIHLNRVNDICKSKYQFITLF